MNCRAFVNGPIARELRFNSGLYLFGPTMRANATSARAISLLLQRGRWGNPFRAVGFPMLAPRNTATSHLARDINITSGVVRPLADPFVAALLRV
jgi:hypothetical protein